MVQPPGNGSLIWLVALACPTFNPAGVDEHVSSDPAGITCGYSYLSPLGYPHAWFNEFIYSSGIDKHISIYSAGYLMRLMEKKARGIIPIYAKHNTGFV